jgi:hypothetical protein
MEGFAASRPREIVAARHSGRPNNGQTFELFIFQQEMD